MENSAKIEAVATIKWKIRGAFSLLKDAEIVNDNDEEIINAFRRAVNSSPTCEVLISQVASRSR